VRNNVLWRGQGGSFNSTHPRFHVEFTDFFRLPLAFVSLS
jgi:hypothetical protein